MLIQPVNIRSNSMLPALHTKKSNTQKSEKNHSIPAGGFYYPLVSFSGGYSMSLADTKKQLDMHSRYPGLIREEIDRVLESGNPDNKTLIDIHLSQYSLLDECETLEEAQELYPEFADVISDKDIEIRKGTFLEKVKAGEVKAFDPEKDTALQLLQLYWGKGFSLNTLSSDYAGQNIFGAFRSLNIPRVDKTYGQYLKLSDKDYNARYTAEISKRMKNIERKPLTDEQKKAVSDGLKQFYIEHPEKLAQMSAAHKRFYKEHPEESEKFSQVMLRAWGYKEANPIKQAMSNFFKKPLPEKSEKEIVKFLTGAANTDDKKTMQEFWDKNEWAAKVFSKCMKKSWARQDELSKLGLMYEPVCELEFLPRLLKIKFAQILQNDAPDFEKKAKIIVPDKRDGQDTYDFAGSFSNIICDMFKAFTILGRQDCMDDLSKCTARIFLHQTDGAENIKVKNPKDAIYIEEFAKSYIANKDLPDFINLTAAYCIIISAAAKAGDFDTIERFDKLLNKEYEKVRKENAKQQKKLRQAKKALAPNEYNRLLETMENFRRKSIIEHEELKKMIL